MNSESASSADSNVGQPPKKRPAWLGGWSAKGSVAQPASSALSSSIVKRDIITGASLSDRELALAGGTLERGGARGDSGGMDKRGMQPAIAGREGGASSPSSAVAAAPRIVLTDGRWEGGASKEVQLRCLLNLP